MIGQKNQQKRQFIRECKLAIIRHSFILIYLQNSISLVSVKKSKLQSELSIYNIIQQGQFIITISIYTAILQIIGKHTRQMQQGVVQMQQLTMCLQQTIIGSSTEQIRQAEDMLRSYHGYQNFLPVLFQLIKQQELPYNIRKAAVVYLTTYCKLQFGGPSMGNTNININRIKQVTVFLFGKLGDQAIQFQLRKLIINSLLYLIRLDTNGIVKCMLYDFCASMSSNMVNLITDNQPLKLSVQAIFSNSIQVGLSLLTVLLSSINTTKQLNHYIRQSFANFILLFDYLVTLCNHTLNQKIEQQKSTTMPIYNVLSMVKLYSSTLKLYMKKVAYSDLETVKLLFSPAFCQFIYRLGIFNIKDNQIQGTFLFYCRNFEQKISEIFNAIKGNYLQCLGMTIRVLLQYFRSQVTISMHPFFCPLQSSPLGALILNNFGSQISSQLSSMPYICLLPQFLVATLQSLLSHIHFRIQKLAPNLLKSLQQLLNCLLILLKNDYNFNTFINLRKVIIEHCLIPILQVNNNDLNLLHGQGEQLRLSILSIVNMDPEGFINKRKGQLDFNMDEIADDGIQEYTTLRTVASTLLGQYCNRIDGTLNQLLSYIFQSLSKANCKEEKRDSVNISTLLLLASIISEQLSSGIKSNGSISTKQEIGKMLDILTKLLCQCPIPNCIYQTFSKPTSESSLSVSASPELNEQQLLIKNYQFMMLLIAIYKYLAICSSQLRVSQHKFSIVGKQAINALCYRIISVIEKQHAQEIVRTCAYDMLTYLANLSQIQYQSDMQMNIQKQEQKLCFIVKLVEAVNRLLISQPVCSHAKLQTLYNLFKYYDKQIMKSPPEGHLVIQSFQILSKYLQTQHNHSDLTDLQAVNKCWNLIVDFCCNSLFVTRMACQFDGILNNLVTQACIVPQDPYRQKIIDCLTGIIAITQQVSPNILSMYIIIAKSIFYQLHKRQKIPNSKQKQNQNLDQMDLTKSDGQIMKAIQTQGIYKFEHVFELTNLILQYGTSADNGTMNQEVLREIAQMCIKNIQHYSNSINGYCCQGLLILQNLFLRHIGNLRINLIKAIQYLTVKILAMQQQQFLPWLFKYNLIIILALLLLNQSDKFSPAENMHMLLQVISNTSNWGNSARLCYKKYQQFYTQQLQKSPHSYNDADSNSSPNMNRIVVAILSQVIGKFASTLQDNNNNDTKIIVDVINTVLDVAGMLGKSGQHKSKNSYSMYKQNAGNKNNGQKQKINEQLQQQYKIYLPYINNPISQLNQIQILKSSIKQLKGSFDKFTKGLNQRQMEEQEDQSNSNKPTAMDQKYKEKGWDQLIQSIQKDKVQLLKQIMATVKVKNQSRQIFKIKR